jgi:hypothetical protein
LEREQALLLRSKEALEKEQPLRELEMTADEKKLIKGFMFLSQKPILYVVNIGESTTLGDDLEAAVASSNWMKWRAAERRGDGDLRQGRGRAGGDGRRGSGGVSGQLRAARERAGAADPQEL